MKLNKILENVDFKSNVADERLNEVEICEITYDSRNSAENTIFVAIKGETVDGHNYVQKAYDNGCRVFILNQEVNLNEDAVKIYVEDSRKALSRMSSNFFENPTSKIKVIGVTGTKGKTTITNYIKSVLCHSGINTGVIGTNGVFYNDYEGKTINTTPESYELHKIINDMVYTGVDCVAMEVSSGGLMMNRVDDIEFDIGVYTNLSPDHIGPKEHPTFEHYRECKSRLFSLCKYGVVNIDDENAKYIIENSKAKITTFSIKFESDLRADNIELTRTPNSLGSKFEYIELDGNRTNVEISSPGEFSIYNALAVISVCKYLGIEKQKMLDALSVAQVDGRVEVLSILPHATVVVDYAHNGMSLENVLNTLLQYEHNRLICVFGSIGGRSAIRRKELGDVAAQLCDVCVLTTDNPDNEDPMNIIEDIAESFIGTDVEIHKIVDRAEAIYKAMKLAKEGDMIIVTGKGHEKYQIVNGERIFYDEKGEVRKAAKRVISEMN